MGRPGEFITARVAVAAVGIAAAVAFLPSLGGGFVYDDHRFYEGNEHLRSVAILWRAFTDPVAQTADGTHAGLWRPLRTLSLAFDHALFGSWAFGPHLVSVGLHAVGAALVTLLLLAWRLPALAAAIGGAVYAFHPAQVECVAWISSRGDLLAAAFVWASLLADLRGRPRAALLAGIAALLSKEQAVVWPALAVLSHVAAGNELRRALRSAVAPAIVVLVFVGVRQSLLLEPTQQGGLGVPVGAAQVVTMLGHQGLFTLTGVGSLFDWQMPPGLHPLGTTLAGVGLFAGVAWRPSRIPAAWFLVAVGPTLLLQPFVPLNILVADRFLLFALPALAFAVATSVARLPRLEFPGALAAVALGATSLALQPIWRDDAALWGRTARLVPAHFRAHAWLGEAAIRENRFEDAESHFMLASLSAPGDARTTCRLAQAREVVGKQRQDIVRIIGALQAYRDAIAAFGSARAIGDARAEGAADLLPQAQWAVADLLLVLGESDHSRAEAEALLSLPIPVVGAETRRALNARLAQFAARLDRDGQAALAARVREFGARP